MSDQMQWKINKRQKKKKAKKINKQIGYLFTTKKLNPFFFSLHPQKSKNKTFSGFGGGKSLPLTLNSTNIII